MQETQQIIGEKSILDENGEIDLQLSYMQANQMHADYISSIFRSANGRIKDLVSATIKFVSCPKCLFAN
ncbi:MAG: hypothetical protein QNJ69_01580 [Gammaproteobacteria bacterium]|nr:hypothetical protein [Gammaproteobacteria bacterium]